MGREEKLECLSELLDSSLRAWRALMGDICHVFVFEFMLANTHK